MTREQIAALETALEYAERSSKDAFGFYKETIELAKQALKEIKKQHNKMTIIKHKETFGVYIEMNFDEKTKTYEVYAKRCSPTLSPELKQLLKVKHFENRTEAYQFFKELCEEYHRVC